MQSSRGDLENENQDLREDETSMRQRLNVFEEQKKSEVEAAVQESVAVPERTTAKKALDTGLGRLLDYMIPDPILDCARQSNLLSFRECRDIKEQQTTTEKNRNILETIRRKGEVGYSTFKDCLLKTGQSLIVDLLTSIERDEDATNIELQLHDEMTNGQQKELKELKEDLITLYRKQYHTLPQSPLFEEHDTPLLDFYVMPDINKVEIQRFSGGGKEIKSKLTTFCDIFFKENQRCREIYLTAEAGLGKTAFSKRLVQTWCQAHKCIENETECFNKKEIDAMSDFEFVFLLSLRDCSEECDIDEMIRKQIVPRLTNTPKNIETVLSKEKCLVILDGLDEWTHPTSSCILKPRDIPHRKARVCTILTTTRSWKLSVINLNSSQVDQKVEIEGLNKTSRDKLKENVISHFNDVKGEQLRCQIIDFDSAVADKGVSDLETIPILLLYLLCLWCDNVGLGRSKCEIYWQIVELLLNRTFTKHPKIKGKCCSSLSDIPACFTDYENCQSHCAFLISLGELAFQTLFIAASENRLVFDSSITENYLKEEFLELARLTGIITQGKQSRLTSQIRKTSFSHKTVQEFFAALYISTYSDKDKVLPKVLSLCNSIRDILNLSNVFIFISGMNSELFALLSNKLMKVINEDEITRNYRSTAGYCYWEDLLKEMQDMFVSCSKEIPENKKVNICLQDFFFNEKCYQENYYTSLQRLALQNKPNIKSIYIDEGQHLSKIIDSCGFSDPEIHCQKIYCRCGIKEGELMCLLSNSVKCLYIGFIEIDNTCKITHSFLTDEQCKTFHNSSRLETIYIDWFEVSHEFLNYLINVKSIKQITLNWLHCSDHSRSCPGFNFDLSQHTELRKLVLRQYYTFTLCDMNKGESSLLHNMRNIEYMELRRLKMSSLLLLRLVEIIEHLEHPVEVKLDECEITPREEFVNIRDYICRSESFVVQQDIRNGYRDELEFVTNK